MSAALCDLLLPWFDGAARELPWRSPEAGAWAVLVSEVMLQQTPVARVLGEAPGGGSSHSRGTNGGSGPYQAWLTRWPTPAALAADSPGEAVRMWGRLGYPRRALRLRECAIALVERHGGEVPEDVEALLALPGVGAYTARAVAAFAYGQRVPVVDTNVRRAVARAVEGAAEAAAPSTTRDLAAVEALLPADPVRAARFSAALMELGAVVCTARAPRCGQCPVMPLCAWQLAGSPPYEGPTRRGQKFEGTDRQVRGLLMSVLREVPGPVERARLDVVWPDAVQRDRALSTLIRDGLLESLDGDLFALPG